jgi:flagellar hook-length control protein FliK
LEIHQESRATERPQETTTTETHTVSELKHSPAPEGEGRAVVAEPQVDSALFLRGEQTAAPANGGQHEPDPQNAGENSAPIDSKIPAAEEQSQSEGSTVESGQVSLVAGPTGAMHESQSIPDVQPHDVALQIAHEAHVYRLAGGRAVRLRLQPEGLGEVEVTIRYGTSRQLELHVVVEHAETGTLVQQGWSELRDALSAQGLTTERMVVSVAGMATGDTSSALGNGRETITGEGAAFGSGTPSNGGQDRSDQRRSGHASAPFDHGLEPRLHEKPSAGHEKTSRIDYRV